MTKITIYSNAVRILTKDEEISIQFPDDSNIQLDRIKREKPREAGRFDNQEPFSL